jgi:hypothetical protein
LGSCSLTEPDADIPKGPAGCATIPCQRSGITQLVTMLALRQKLAQIRALAALVAYSLDGLHQRRALTPAPVLRNFFPKTKKGGCRGQSPTDVLPPSLCPNNGAKLGHAGKTRLTIRGAPMTPEELIDELSRNVLATRLSRAVSSWEIIQIYQPH